MKIESLRIGLRVRHPQYGLGEVKSIAEATASVLFGEGPRTVSPETSGLEPAEPAMSVSGLEMPLDQFLKNTVTAVLDRLGFEKTKSVADQLGTRWHKNKQGVHPAGASLPPQEERPPG